MTLRIYTRTGDDGSTGLFGGGRVDKDHPRVETFGAVDELNAALGVARAAGPDARLDAVLAALQRACFDLGADLATPAGTPAAARLRRIGAADVASLEAAIDEHEAELTPLQNFVLPGGTPVSAHLHAARGVCRRAERRTLALVRAGEASPETLKWLNRLSDLLFVLARVANARAGVGDVPWSP